MVGSWGEDAPGKPSLTIAADGSYHGTDGCNSLVGNGTIDDDTFDFGDMASTMMACPDVDAWLSAAATATVSGTRLSVQSEDGTTIGTLHRR